MRGREGEEKNHDKKKKKLSVKVHELSTRIS
jgi:hypothetical protein